MVTRIRTALIGEVATINPKGPGSRTLSQDDLLDFLPMSDLSEDGTMAVSAQRPYSEVAKGYTAFRGGDVLLAKITPCFENNKIGLADVATEWAFGSTEFHVLRPGKDVDSRYLLHFLRQDAIRMAGERRMTGSGGQRRVPKSFLEELPIPLPPLAEQKRIAAILDLADALRRLRRRALDRLNTLGQAIFHEMFSPGIEEGVYPVSELAEVVHPDTIVTYGIVQAGEEVEGGVPYIRTGDIVEGTIEASGLRHTDPAIAARFKRSEVRSGEIVMSIRATVGTTAIVPPELDGANLTQGTARISPGPFTRQSYLLEYLRSPPVQSWISRQIKGATFREITLSRLRQLPVSVPSVDLQTAFEGRYRQAVALRDIAHRQLGAIENVFTALQHRAFTGQL